MPANAEAPATVRVQENVPEPLFAFYEAAKGRPDLLGTQNRIHAAVVVRPGGMLLFGTENQGGFELLTETALCEAAIGGFGGFASARREQVRRLVEPLRWVPLRPLRWPTDPTHHYVGPGVVVMASDCGDDTFEVTVGARHRAALRPFRTPGFAWQSFDG